MRRTESGYVLFILRNIPFEGLIWACGLFYLAVINPLSHGQSYDLCLWKLCGLGRCPGCGLGLSISYLLHGDIGSSWQTHPLGIAALPVLFSRIIFTFGSFYKTVRTYNRKDHTNAEYNADSP